jgi:hypothetical protein
MKYLILTGVALGVSALLLVAGCGGSTPGTSGPAIEPARAAATLTQSPTLAQLKATLVAVGKPLPDFLDGSAPAVTPVAPAGQVSPASYMTNFVLGRWMYSQYVDSHRTQWYECILNNPYNLTDVYVRDLSGDPDLFVFSPLRPGNASNSLELIGYSVSDGLVNEQVGSFTAADWHGAGRFVVAVWGYTNSHYDLRIW